MVLARMQAQPAEGPSGQNPNPRPGTVILSVKNPAER